MTFPFSFTEMFQAIIELLTSAEKRYYVFPKHKHIHVERLRKTKK